MYNMKTISRRTIQKLYLNVQYENYT